MRVTRTINAKNVKWLLSGVLAAGVVGYVPAPAPAADRHAQEGPGRGETEVRVKYNDLPDVVRNKLDEIRGNKKPTEIFLVTKGDGQKFYRTLLDFKGKDRYVRISPAGHELTETEVIDRAAEPSRESTREPAREPRTERPSTVRPSARPESVDFDTLPGHAKEAIGREAGAYTQRGKVYRSANRGGTPIYSAEVSDGNRSKMITVDALGKVYAEADDTNAGEKVVSLNDVPYNPKVTLGKEAGAGKIGRVVQTTGRSGKTVYTALVRDNTGPYWITVDDAGNVLGEQDAKR